MQLPILASRSSVCFAFYEKTSYVQNLAYFLVIPKSFPCKKWQNEGGKNGREWKKQESYIQISV